MLPFLFLKLNCYLWLWLPLLTIKIFNHLLLRLDYLVNIMVISKTTTFYLDRSSFQEDASQGNRLAYGVTAKPSFGITLALGFQVILFIKTLKSVTIQVKFKVFVLIYAFFILSWFLIAMSDLSKTIYTVLQHCVFNQPLSPQPVSFYDANRIL